MTPDLKYMVSRLAEDSLCFNLDKGVTGRGIRTTSSSEVTVRLGTGGQHWERESLKDDEC